MQNIQLTNNQRQIKMVTSHSFLNKLALKKKKQKTTGFFLEFSYVEVNNGINIILKTIWQYSTEFKNTYGLCPQKNLNI